MRAWGQRPDTIVCDEPLYAYYLQRTGVAHPGADEVIHSQETDWRKVARWLTGPVPDGKSIFYQKHMTHHLLPEVDRAWLGRLDHAFLIREPREVVASFARVAGEPRLEETGLPQQLEIFELVRRKTGTVPPVVDARDVLNDPRRLLELLCGALGVKFMDVMLSWPAGPRETDGVWARHWYQAVLQSTSFQPYSQREVAIPAHMSGLLARAEAIYGELYEHRLGQ
jgi:hypothetical protein